MSVVPVLDTDKDSFSLFTSNLNSVLSKVGDRPFALILMNSPDGSSVMEYFIRYLAFKAEKENPSSSSTSSSSSAAASIESWINSKTTPKFEPSKKSVAQSRAHYQVDLWSEPFIVKAGGRDVAVLLMKGRGYFDYRTTERQRAIIFSFTSLCSSTSIFDMSVSISESVLQEIQFFSQNGPCLIEQQQKTKDYNDSGSSLNEQQQTSSQKQSPNQNPSKCQRLIFLRRNILSQSTHAFGYHGNDKNKTGARNYCREVFDSSAESKRPPEKVFVRERILESYKDVGCFLMPRSKYQYVDGVLQQTDEQFDKYMKEFVELVLSPQNLVTKKIHGEEITGDGFKKFVEEWAKLFEIVEDNFPASLGSSSVITNTLALNTASAYYEKAMSSFLQTRPCGPLDSEVVKFHVNLKQEALRLFDKIAISISKDGEDNLRDKYRISLLAQIQKNYESKLTPFLNVKKDEEPKTNKSKDELQDKMTKDEQQKILQEQLEESERRHQEALKNYRREIEKLKTALQMHSGPEKRETYDCANMRVLFINQKFDFPGNSNNPQYKKRDGADSDGHYVINLFEKTLGMKLDVEENVPSDGISWTLKSFKRKCIVDKNDGCIVIISTHGIDPHFLLMDDLKLINLEKLVIQKFGRDEFPEFNGKPKIFLFNACRMERSYGTQIPEFIEKDSVGVMRYSDILIGKSTLPLFPSYRHPLEGSFYIKYLHDVCLENVGKKMEIQDLLNSVGRKVAEELEKLEKVVQIPPIELRLFTKNLYLKPQNSA